MPPPRNTAGRLTALDSVIAEAPAGVLPADERARWAGAILPRAEVLSEATHALAAGSPTGLHRVDRLAEQGLLRGGVVQLSHADRRAGARRGAAVVGRRQRGTPIPQRPKGFRRGAGSVAQDRRPPRPGLGPRTRTGPHPRADRHRRPGAVGPAPDRAAGRGCLRCARRSASRWAAVRRLPGRRGRVGAARVDRGGQRHRRRRRDARGVRRPGKPSTTWPTPRWCAAGTW